MFMQPIAITLRESKSSMRILSQTNMMYVSMKCAYLDFLFVPSTHLSAREHDSLGYIFMQISQS